MLILYFNLSDYVFLFGLSYTVNKGDKNSLWEVFGLKENAKQLTLKDSDKTKLLQIENENLKIRLEEAQKEPHRQPVSPYYSNYHQCSNCGYGFQVSNNDSLGIYNFETRTIAIYPHSISCQKVLECPKCKNLDKASVL